MESSRIHISAMSYYARARDGCGLLVYPERTLKGRHLTAGWKIGLRQRQRWALLGVLQFQRSPVMSGTFHVREPERTHRSLATQAEATACHPLQKQIERASCRAKVSESMTIQEFAA